jgi:hypothetical protein
MGLIGGMIGSGIGSIIGKIAGGKKHGKDGSKIGGGIGAIAGGLTPFKKGGRVAPNKKKNVPTPILAHSGEVVIGNNLPALQKYALAKINAKKRKDKK